MKRLVVAYRDNDLFHKYVPEILELLPQQEVMIEKIVFSPQTDVKEIRSTLVKRLTIIKGPFSYLSDNTCTIRNLESEGLLNRCYSDASPEIRIRRSLTLDDCFCLVADKMFSRQDFTSIFCRLAKSICENPSQIYVVERNITDHLWGMCRDGQHLVKTTFAGSRYKFAQHIKGILEKLYPHTKVYVKETLESAIRGAVQSCNENTLLVADRHCGIYDEMKDARDITTWPYNFKLFCLPFENAVFHLMTLGKIKQDFDVKALYKEIFADIL